MLNLIKMAVGGLLMITFACPLTVVARNKSIWEEPMVLLVANLAVTDFFFGLTISSIGFVDMLFPLEPSAPCVWAMFGSYGIATGIKMSHMLIAIDQFVAIRFSLRYYELMERIVRGLLSGTWLVVLIHIITGVVMDNFPLEKVVESYNIGNSTQTMHGCRYETIVPFVYHTIFEFEIGLLSFGSAGLFIYTAFVGMRQKARICATRAEISRDLESHSFFANYRAFRKLVRVILLTLLLDGLALVHRRISLSYPMPQVSAMVHQLRLSLIVIEFWVYAMASVKLRAAFRKTFGCCVCCGEEEPDRSPVFVVSGGAGGGGGKPQMEPASQLSAAGGIGQVAVILRPSPDAWGAEPDQHSRPI